MLNVIPNMLRNIGRNKALPNIPLRDNSLLEIIDWVAIFDSCLESFFGFKPRLGLRLRATRFVTTSVLSVGSKSRWVCRRHDEGELRHLKELCEKSGLVQRQRRKTTTGRLLQARQC